MDEEQYLRNTLSSLDRIMAKMRQDILNQHQTTRDKILMDSLSNRNTKLLPELANIVVGYLPKPKFGEGDKVVSIPDPNS